MSYPFASDHNKSTPPSASSTPQPHPSLPARPPPLAAGPHRPTTNGTSENASHGQPRSSTPTATAFTAFKPRAVNNSTQDWRSHSHARSAGPAPPSGYSTSSTPSYSMNNYQQPQYSGQPQPYNQQYYYNHGSQATPPQIQNPFPLPNQANQSSYNYDSRSRQSNGNYDPEMEAEIAQWQSAYATKDETAQAPKSGRGVGPESAGGANAVALGSRGRASQNQESHGAGKPDSGAAPPVVLGPDGKPKTVVRKGGGQTWQDSSLLEWDPAHFRLFVGNLAGEVTDDSLLKAFSKYDSVQKAKVIRDKRTTKSKGFGFVSFSNGDDYFRAGKDMQGKYIGSHPVLLRRSTTDVRPSVQVDKNKKNKLDNKANPGSNFNNANTGAGVSKKQAKTKGGLKILG